MKFTEFIILFFFFFCFVANPVLACKCRHYDEKHTVDWNASYKCCFGAAFGVWVNKDCKGRVDGKAFTYCCGKSKLDSDCRLTQGGLDGNDAPELPYDFGSGSA